MAKNDQISFDWQAYNQQSLFAELAEMRQILLKYLSAHQSKPGKISKVKVTKVKKNNTSLSSALTNLCQTLSLNDFERKVLLLCVGVQLINDFPHLCEKIHGEKLANYPTLGLLLLVFPKEAYLQVLAPQAALRYWMLIDMEAGPSLLTQRLRVNDYILQYLLGNINYDERLTSFLKPINNAHYIIPSHKKIIDHIWEQWSKNSKQDRPSRLHLSMGNKADTFAIIANASQQWRIPAYYLNISLLPNDSKGLELLQRLLQREALMKGFIYLIEHDVSVNEKPALRLMLTSLIESLPNFILMGQNLPGWLDYPLQNIDVHCPTQQEQLYLWQTLLTKTFSPSTSWLERLCAQFNLSASQIQNIATVVNTQTTLSKSELPNYIWQQCRQHARQQISELIHVIEPKASWDDLVLPESSLRILHDISLHVAYRHKVYQHWGFAEKSSRGLGISALFAGPSGTGKTLAAEVLAKELQVDLYHIDLSMVVSKYIGETEKNIKKIFDIAEASGALLLFDEADALFGKRSEVKDSHDRYANIEVSYLLQRIEAYQGLSILTTNLKTEIDDAFLRRIRFILQFPFPDFQHRKLIWQQIFPKQTPIKNLDYDKLARLDLTGGNIRNIALNAAFLTANKDKAVTMQHILDATKKEYLKLEKILLDSQIKDWV